VGRSGHRRRGPESGFDHPDDGDVEAVAQDGRAAAVALLQATTTIFAPAATSRSVIWTLKHRSSSAVRSPYG
jgi:hypothetical protein